MSCYDDSVDFTSPLTSQIDSWWEDSTGPDPVADAVNRTLR
eukprot:CAMPEP_0204341360 /NCGR_PEP_ID=MMETSP0469-20131031/23291_1 /ASSEMBLY_ACC=CAM_ASM_000384 /TAXON_ID=2969 /ORGANISM="Oxyrrhis marina" /LENGTH=40 /DNA_ID= /DNA_START= /DNA_END= /DNA_ORIENTATION=